MKKERKGELVIRGNEKTHCKDYQDWLVAKGFRQESLVSYLPIYEIVPHNSISDIITLLFVGISAMPWKTNFVPAFD